MLEPSRKSQTGERLPPPHARTPCSSTRRPDRGSEGFTLLEVLVALTILGMSFATLLAIFSQALASERNRDRAFAARTLAQSLMAQTLAAQSVDEGTLAGHTDDGLSWQVRIEPYGSRSGEPAEGLEAARVSTTVRWSGAINAQSLTLATLRVIPREQSK